MKKKYILLCLLLFAVSLCHKSHSQQTDIELTTVSEGPIEGLNVFPNPITNGKVYINSKLNLKKDIEIFDVLGKKIIATSLMRRELDVSKLTPGVYILKVSENNKSTTRKLVVR